MISKIISEIKSQNFLCFRQLSYIYALNINNFRILCMHNIFLFKLANIQIRKIESYEIAMITKTNYNDEWAIAFDLKKNNKNLHMKILVCISSVPDTTSKINFTADKSAFDKNGIQWVINPYDEFALTKAVKLQESQGATVTIATVGDAATEAVMRKALAIGANDAIRVNAEPQDSITVAKELAKIVEEGGYDLVFCGKESIDYNGAAVPAMIAQLLNRPFVNACVGLEVNGAEATVVREIEGGKETLTVKIPAVIAGQKGMVEEKDLIIPNMRGIMSARTKPLTVKEPTETDVKVSAVSFDAVPARAQVKLVSADNLDELVRLLHEEAKVI